jgi:formimidoylglutamate deiminase
VDEVQATTGARPVEWAMANMALGPRWCLIHCTQMMRAETLALAATGAVAGLCPLTEANLGDGIFDGIAWAGAGGRMGLGSDSNIRISLAEELRQLDHSQRLRDQSRAPFADGARSTTRVLWEAACAGGAQAAGRESGRIATGALADLLALDAGALDLQGLTGDRRLDAAVFAAPALPVSDLWSAGRHIVQEGRHVRRDAIRAAYAATIRRLRADL